jgi:hypothetical protein
VLVCWAVLIPAKLWAGSKGDSWIRRFIMLLVGAGVGALAFWLDGGMPRTLPPEMTQTVVHTPTFATFLGVDWVGQLAGYLSYFGVMFFAVRWWKMAGPRRQSRFSFLPVLVVGVWSLVLLLIWPQMMSMALLLVVASVVVQLVSPWDGPSVPVARKIKPRYA